MSLMIHGIGIDMIELDRIEQAVNKNKRFVKRILTKAEIAIFKQLPIGIRKYEFLAGRFAAKEAFAKAAGTGIGSLSFQHIEILSMDSGAPKMHVKGFEADNIHLSISHSKSHAIAQVVITK